MAAAARHGITLGEAIAVVFAESSIQILVGPRDEMVMYVGGRIGRVIVVEATREYRETTRYGISDVYPAEPSTAYAWERRQR